MMSQDLETAELDESPNCVYQIATTQSEFRFVNLPFNFFISPYSSFLFHCHKPIPEFNG